MSFPKRKTVKRVMAYFGMPLLFSVIGYGLFYLALSPLLSPAFSALGMVVSDSRPDFSDELSSIFSPPEDTTAAPADTVNEKDVQMPQYGTHYARLQIGDAGIDADLYFGDGPEILKKGVGQYMGSFIPGSGKPVMISGHNNGAFHKLQKVAEGDTITITTNYGVYEYRVTSMSVHKESDKTAYDLRQQNEQLILYTCYPFDMLGLTSNRYFVYADKISGPSIVSGN
jgi:sortase A